MTSEAVNITQGTKAWHEHRAKHFNASDASAMAGVSKYKTRSQLLREKATGIAPDVDEATKRRFDKGHENEATARPWAEEIIGDELFPVVLRNVIDGLPLSASLDGLTMLDDVAFENKSLNAELDDALSNGIIPEEYHWQMEQQLMLSGASKCLFMASNGERETMRYAWYMPRPEIRARLLAGWKQFAEDLANYQHVETKPEAIGRTPDQLPALRIEVTGMVTASNLAEFKETALTVFRGINTNLQTDQDFADAERAVKFCKDAEDRLEAAKSHALSQTASIDDLFRTIDEIKEEARTVRLKLDKLVKAEKENRKTEIVQQAQAEYRKHIDALNTRIGGAWMPSVLPAFAESIKGLKSLDSMRDKIATTMANAKIEANEIADRIEANYKAMTATVEDRNWNFLIPDFAQVCTKSGEDFDALLASRIARHKATAEAERARIQAEEKAKADAQIEAVRQEAIKQERERAEQEAKAKAEEDQRGKAEVAGARVATVNTGAASTPPTPIDQRAAVVEHQDEIAAFMASRDFKNPGSVRAILIEFVKFQETRKATQ